MSRRPSAVASPASSSGPHSRIVPSSIQRIGNEQSRPNVTKSLSMLSTEKPTKDVTGILDGIDPDNLFAKHTVSEVKVVQQRLRSNAEAKQEELRLMVGERYRDLLQASTSIISMALTSKRVVDAFNEMRNIAGSADPSYTTKRSSMGEDKQLQALQSLSAHLKLLLDAPEHLWRFMEKKMYFHAAWLFLTARLVHRTLLREDEGENQSWHMYGIDVSEQIPLAQRQWDAISQFRSQIANKATLFLREGTTSPGEVCAALLTLHLLESRPLPETLTIFLAQRTKMLTTLLSRAQNAAANGHVAEASGSSDNAIKKSRRAVVWEIKQKLEAVLDLISHTLGAVRTVFVDDRDASQVSMMTEALQHIQGAQITPASLPNELQLTTDSLLTSLPSSAHFALLPSSIRGYKPYVQGGSSSFSVTQAQVHEKLQRWFSKSVTAIEPVMSSWLSKLESIREAWDVRKASCSYIMAHDRLETEEKAHLMSTLDIAFKRQVTSIWKATLDQIEAAFGDRLTSVIDTLQQNPSATVSDSQPVHYLFHAPALPSSSQSSNSSSKAASPFQKYKSSLQLQLKGRTPLLDDVLSVIERQSSRLQQEIEYIQSTDQDTRNVAPQFLEGYRTEAQALCWKIVDALTLHADSSHDTETTKQTWILVGRIAYELASSSTFITTLGCADDVVDEFRRKLRVLHGSTVLKWQEDAVRRIVQTYWPVRTSYAAKSRRTSAIPRPSPVMLQAVLSLSSMMAEMRTYQEHSPPFQSYDSLRSFATQLKDNFSQKPAADLQDYWDLKFLRKLMGLWRHTAPDEFLALDEYISQLREQLVSDGITEPHLDDDSKLAEQLLRMQILFAPILPSSVNPPTSPKINGKITKQSALLCHGDPMVDQHFQPALDTVKPSSRFGLLLLSSSLSR
ncbi:hypothetical protein WOLCODRAFT_94557 [Wolfiporia cocos MD-104 SS10]|uniref:Conserved oligomeric Golgi complex subunit 1 n=1 Tax=Wolfiporia cocos (strain MD-104) TaxID=742152 RepID=A0A2H3J2H2_WOLCO|nr:hypothetical protein WOLCODRAFT_94557 [Wolfiporia cocos MD-104 SS10]